MARTRKDYKHLFEEKLRQESGFADLEIDWSTYHRTAPVYFRSRRALLLRDEEDTKSSVSV